MSLIEGVKVSLGGEEYVVPPLSFKQLRTLQPKIAQLAQLGKSKDSLPSLDQLDTVAEIVHAALSRNYPKLTLDEVTDALDLSNMKLLIPAIMGVSGLVSQGEESVGSQ